MQAAETIFMALRAYYTEVKENDLSETEAAVPNQESSNNQGTNFIGEDDDDLDETCQLSN